MSRNLSKDLKVIYFEHKFEFDEVYEFISEIRELDVELEFKRKRISRMECKNSLMCIMSRQ